MKDEQLRWSGLKVGIVVLIGLVIFVFIVSIVGTEQNIFSSTYEMKLFMPNVRGLVEGAMVTLGGLKIGYVTGMRFVTKDDTTGVDITMKVLTKYSHSVTVSSVAQIKTIGLLGDRYVDISIGRENEAPLAEGSLLPMRESFDLEEAGPQINKGLKDFAELLSNASGITASINRGEGSVGRMIARPDLADEMEHFLKSLNRIAAAVEGEKGTLGRMVYDPALSQDLAAVTGNLRTVTDQLRKGQGSMGKLIMDESLYSSLASFSARADSIMAKAGADSSNVSKLISDPEFYSRISRLLEDLDLLLVDLRENPDRYVKVSVF
ncbi:MAG TPA: MlaD family protein [Bacteroidota bacterium]|nr:MlaD family protein [Bacteroidota bacterium]